MATWLGEMKFLRISFCPMLKEMWWLQYVHYFVLEQCEAMEALPVKDDFKTRLSQKKNDLKKNLSSSYWVASLVV
jgi:hypothetical protein